MTLSLELARRQKRAESKQTAAYALARVERAEERLTEARAAYSAAAQGDDTTSIFGDCEFIRRSSADPRDRTDSNIRMAESKSAALLRDVFSIPA